MIETQVGETVLFAARFRECAARSLFLPRTDPGRRVPLWQQRLRAAQLLNAARLKRNFPLLLETARECLQDDYDMPALRRIMTDIQSGNIGLVDVTTDIASPFAENLLFGYVGTVMYQYDVPQAERSAQLLSIDPMCWNGCWGRPISRRSWILGPCMRSRRSWGAGRSGTSCRTMTSMAGSQDTPRRTGLSPSNG